MNKAMKNIGKILLTGLVTTIVRIIGQLSIPAGEQTVLAPSIFAQNGTMPHVAGIDRITYPAADSLALIVMGLMLGRLFGESKDPAGRQKTPFPSLPFLHWP